MIDEIKRPKRVVVEVPDGLFRRFSKACGDRRKATILREMMERFCDGRIKV